MGGGGGGTMQSTTVTSNIPEYARPYVENMLGAAQQQIFQPDESGQYVGFNQYHPYSTDPTKYFAPPTSAQEQAYGEIQGLSTPTQFDQATGMANLAGLGQLGLTDKAGEYGGMGANIGAAAANTATQGFNTGDEYKSTVTNPNKFSAYMSPYTQQVIAPQLAQAQIDFEMANNTANLAAARQGTYGGARQALQQSEREKALNINKANIIGQGLSNAYDRAQQSIQFGAGLGLQGLQTGYQGLGLGLQGAGLGLQGVGQQQAGLAGASNTAGTLTNIGSQQQAGDLSRINSLSNLGTQYQNYNQGVVNQAVQDYATAQQYPYMQLGMMSSLLRGLPVQGMTTEQYQAQPSLLQQGAGLLGAYGAYQGSFKEGGHVKKYDVGGEVEHKVKKIGDADPSGKGLASLMVKTKSPGVKRIIASEMVDNKPPVKMARGGLPEYDPLRERVGRMGQVYRDLGVPVPGEAGPKGAELMKLLEDQEGKTKDRAEEDKRLRKAMAFLEFGSTPFGPLRGALEGGKSYLEGEMFARRNLRNDEFQRAQAMANLESGQVGSAQNFIGSAQNALANEAKKAGEERRHAEGLRSREQIAADRNAAMLEAARMRASAASQSTARPTQFDKEMEIEMQSLVAQGMDPSDPITQRKALENIYSRRNSLGETRTATQDIATIDKMLDTLSKQRAMAEYGLGDPEEIDAKISRLQRERESLIGRSMRNPTQGMGQGIGGVAPPSTPMDNRYKIGDRNVIDMIPGIGVPEAYRPQVYRGPAGEPVYLHPDGNYYDEPPGR